MLLVDLASLKSIIDSTSLGLKESVRALKYYRRFKFFGRSTLIFHSKLCFKVSNWIKTNIKWSDLIRSLKERD